MACDLQLARYSEYFRVGPREFQGDRMIADQDYEEARFWFRSPPGGAFPEILGAP
jgi:hypothetical protein